MKPKILYAVPDVHGRADLLEALLGFIRSDSKSVDAQAVVYFLGDVVDRGLGSKRSIELMLEELSRNPESRFHMGNHDWWFMDAVMGHNRTPLFMAQWLQHGGWATLQSYFPDLDNDECLNRIRLEYRHHIAFIENGYLMTRRGHFVFAHAGIDPKRRLDKQEASDFLFIREGFLDHVGATLPIVVHGHSIFEDGPIVTENRISLDTGCFSTNRLVACRLNPSNRSLAFLEASGRPGFIQTAEIEPVLEDRGHGTVYDRLPTLFEHFWES